MDYAARTGDQELDALLKAKITAWHQGDQDAQAWEPSGDDFLSPTLMQAEAMRAALPPDAFLSWFSAYLPRLAGKEPRSLFTPAVVSDRSDGKIAHLDGLNLSRAWCFDALAAALPTEAPEAELMRAAAEAHREASLPHVAGDYMGEHWLASFALLAIGGL
jgi:hypothetical protein